MAVGYNEFPFALPVGILSIYGVGEMNSASGIVGNTNMRFGSVYQIFDGGQGYFSVGQKIKFNKNDVNEVLVYNGVRWTLLPVWLVSDDSPAPPPP